MMTSHQQVEIDHHQHHHQQNSNNNTPNFDYPFTFGACLLIKDDNQILPEWLAYHYTVLIKM